MKRLKKSKELTEAPDPIPAEGILLVDAYEEVFDPIYRDPSRTPPFDDEGDDYWSGILEENKQFQAEQENPTEYDEGHRNFDARRMEANLLFRLALENRQLHAYVRDPELGQT